MASLRECPLDMPRLIRFSTEGDEIAETRLQMMQSLVDPKNFDVFLESPFGKYLLEGITNEAKVEQRGITKVSEFIRAENNYTAAKRRAKFEETMGANRLKERKPMS